MLWFGCRSFIIGPGEVGFSSSHTAGPEPEPSIPTSAQGLAERGHLRVPAHAVAGAGPRRVGIHGLHRAGGPSKRGEEQRQVRKTLREPLGSGTCSPSGPRG